MKLKTFYNEIKEYDEVILIDENRSLIMKVVKDLFSKSYGKIKVLLTKAGRKAIKFFKKEGLEDEAIDIINRNLGTNISNLNQLVKIPIKESINEDFKEWWKEASGNLYGAFSFLPILNVFMEFDKLIKNQDYNIKIMIIYFIIWVMAISGKYFTQKFKQKEKIKALGAKI